MRPSFLKTTKIHSLNDSYFTVRIYRNNILIHIILTDNNVKKIIYIKI